MKNTLLVLSAFGMLFFGACGQDDSPERAEPLQANFSYEVPEACGMPCIVGFTNLSTSAKTYFWEFGDGIASQEESPVHIYYDAGTYQVRLSASADGESSDTSLWVKIKGVLPTASFEVDSVQVCNAPCEITFDNTSEQADSYLWDFGDGRTSTRISPTHNYIYHGIYTVTLKATNELGTTERSKMIVVTGTETPFLKVLSGFSEGDSKTWSAISLLEDSVSISDGGGFQLLFSYQSPSVAGYWVVNRGTLESAYWPNFASEETLGELTLLNANELVFDFNTAAASTVTFGGRVPTVSQITLAWARTSEKPEKNYIMTLVQVP